MTRDDLINFYRMHLIRTRPWSLDWFEALHDVDKATLAQAHIEWSELQADTAAWREEMGYRPDGSD